MQENIEEIKIDEFRPKPNLRERKRKKVLEYNPTHVRRVFLKKKEKEGNNKNHILGIGILHNS